MGDKNNISETDATDLLVKTGHGILKAIYVQPGDRTWIIRDGTSAAGTAVMTVVANANNHFEAPYINHPMNSGIFIDNTVAGASGTIVLVFE